MREIIRPKLKPKEERALNFIKSYTKTHGYPPSTRDLCTGLQLKSSSTGHDYLNRLEAKGYIRKDPDRPRAIEVLEDSGSKQACGYEVCTAPDDYPSGLRKSLENKRVKLYTVDGVSVKCPALRPGDIVVAEEKEKYSNDQWVVAEKGKITYIGKLYYGAGIDVAYLDIGTGNTPTILTGPFEISGKIVMTFKQNEMDRRSAPVEAL